MDEELEKQNFPSPEELERIHRYTRRRLAAEELYVFSVALCDNDVDRDFEQFTLEALEKLKDLFLGKTGVLDHMASAEYQTARLFDTWLETDPSRQTTAGEPYTRLVGKAYLPRSPKNADLMLEIDSGMKKEVSVGCAVASRTCSLCGADRERGGCSHQKGKTYPVDGKLLLCYDKLSHPTDAYEWSFVAVPSQKQAGVIKAFAPLPGQDMKAALQGWVSKKQSVVLDTGAVDQLLRYVEQLDTLAKQAGKYREDALGRIEKLCRLAEPDLPVDLLQKAASQMDGGDLQRLEQALEKKAARRFPLRPQLCAEKSREPYGDPNEAFKI